jgi:hypothetical protein
MGNAGGSLPRSRHGDEYEAYHISALQKTAFIPQKERPNQGTKPDNKAATAKEAAAPHQRYFTQSPHTCLSSAPPEDVEHWAIHQDP